MTSLSLSSLERLAIGVSRISIRPGSTFKRYRKPQPELTFFPPEHGEQIWVFHHVVSNQIIYSHRPVMDSSRALKQIPFNGKNAKPRKLRKDFWRPMAMIQFAEGEGTIGQSVFQKLREFRRLHELSWGSQAEEFYPLNRMDRSKALNNQKANSIADMAAVLGGAGRGNRIWVTEGKADGKAGVEAAKRLAGATIHWASPFDRAHAKSWPENIKHQLGLPSALISSNRKHLDVPAEILADETAQPDQTATTSS